MKNIKLTGNGDAKEDAEKAFDEWWIPFQKQIGAPDSIRKTFLAAFAYGICWSCNVSTDTARTEFDRLDEMNKP